MFALIALVGIGWVSSSSPSNAAALPNGEPLRIALPNFPSTIGNPYQASSLPVIMPTLAVFDPLTIIDGKGEVQPWLAVAWEGDATATRWRIRLRPGVAFANGEPFDAAAVVASLNHMQSVIGRSETIGSALAFVAAARALDSATVEIDLNEPDAFFPRRLALWKIPAPKSWAAGAQDNRWQTASGTGPFVIEQVTPNSIRLKANPRAWNPPKISWLEFLRLPEQSSRLQALSSRTVDVAANLGVEDRALVERAGASFRSRAITTLPLIGFAVEQNPASPLADVRVRQALNYAVDKQAITEVILGGYVQPLAQLALPGVAGYDASLAAYPHDPAKAKALLAQAGFGKGFDLVMRVAATGTDDLTYLQQIAADLRAIGLRVTVTTSTQYEMTRALFEGKHNADLFTTGARGLDPLNDYRLRACAGLTGDHKPFFCDAETVALFRQARAAASADAQAQFMRALLKREHESPPGLFLWQGVNFDGVSSNVEGYVVEYDFIDLHALARGQKPKR
jgi:peptide/nickel transport system substrate-binding protein